MQKNLTIQELLFSRGLPEKAKTKLIRHKDNTQSLNLYEMYRENKPAFLNYQSKQERDVFKGVEYIISFIGESGTLARFIGVYKVLSVKTNEENKFLYDLVELTGFKDLEDRVIIDWGKGTLSWHQWNSEKVVFEIAPPQTFYNKRFIGYLDFVIGFEELKDVINNKNKFKDWFLMLSAVKGIYLILDKSTGEKYIGSAYGDDGIWGRWKEYSITSGHGGNVKLQEIIKKQKDYGKNFQFTILMTLPKSLTDKEVIKHEELFKTKLGTKSFGLNL